MNDLKKGVIVEVRDPDGLTTKARVVDLSGYWVLVKWLEPRWNVRENILMSRKGTTSSVPRDGIVGQCKVPA